MKYNDADRLPKSNVVNINYEGSSAPVVDPMCSKELIKMATKKLRVRLPHLCQLKKGPEPLSTLMNLTFHAWLLQWTAIQMLFSL